MPATDALVQSALSNDPRFRARVKFNLANVAWQVINEDPQPPNYAARVAYARTVLLNLDAYAGQISGWLVSRTNLVGADTTVAVEAGVPVVSTSATDASIQSQLMDDWDAIAGA